MSTWQDILIILNSAAIIYVWLYRTKKIKLIPNQGTKIIKLNKYKLKTRKNP